MCGRFVLSDKKVIKDKFNIELSPSYNITPSQDVLVIKPDPIFMKWSYSPKWKDCLLYTSPSPRDEL